jgi:glycosyltransferase involved in cell wall biosynthesis
MILFDKKIKKPRITIITVTKNSSKTLKRCIKSVAHQKFKKYEHIIIDGNSSDNTVQIIKENKKHLRYAESKADKNLWQAINKGIKVANGEIIGILNSDDILYPNALRIVNRYFKNNSIDFLFGAVKKKRVYQGFSPEKIGYRFNIYPSHSVGFYVKKKIHKQLGLYNENLEYCSDYDFFYKLIKKKKKWNITTKEEVLGKFFTGGVSENINIITKLYYESKVRYLNKQNIFYIILLYILHLLNYFKNRINKI